ncbi:hypothetical protein D3C75_1159990 [compost metagenome]
MSSRAIWLARAVLTQMKWPAGLWAISQLWASLRLGLFEVEYQTRVPGSAQPVMAPVLAQWMVMVSPSASCTSVRKRL